jgi:hypothetical protein
MILCEVAHIFSGRHRSHFIFFDPAQVGATARLIKVPGREFQLSTEGRVGKFMRKPKESD